MKREKAISKILPNKKLFKEVSKLFHKHEALFNGTEDIDELMTALEEELEFMLSSCIKYKTGRIELKGDCDIFDKDSRKEFDTYPSIENRRSSYYLTRLPGLRHLGSGNNSLLLLGRSSILIDNDLYNIDNDNVADGIYLSRIINLSRLLDLAKARIHCKVNPNKVKDFFEWLEKLSSFKERLLRYQFIGLDYYRHDNPDQSWKYLLVTIIHKFNITLSLDTLPIIDKELIAILKDREEAIAKGNDYLRRIKEDNKSFRVYLQLKKE